MRFLEVDPSHAAPFETFRSDLRAHDAATFDVLFAGPFADLSFADFVRRSAAERRDWRPKARQVSRTRYVLVDDEGVAGYAVLQFPLTQDVPDNFLFAVPPSRRGRGFGTLTLNRLLFEGARAGLARARVSCRVNDPAGRRAIEVNRGEWSDDDAGRSRFWIKLR